MHKKLLMMILVMLFSLASLYSDEKCRLRGDANADGVLNISDVPELVEAIIHSPSIIGPCWDWVDVNDDGYIDMSDAYYLLAHLFQGGLPPSNSKTCCEK